MQTLTIAENSNVELKKKLAVLEGAERQAESQRKLVREANDQLAASKEQMVALRKQLEEAQRLRGQAEKAKAEAERVRDKAEQHGYDVGVAETKDALRAEVPAIC